MRGRAWLWVAGAVAVAGVLALVLAWRFPDALGVDGARQSLAYFLAWLALLGASLALHVRRRPLLMLRHALAWGGIMLLLVAAYSYRDLITGVYTDARARILGELMPQRGIAVGEAGVRFRIARDGHFHIEAEVDGRRVSFILDTGASDVVLTRQDARRLGWDPDALDYHRVYETANGPVRGATVRLDELVIGPIRLIGVTATVNESPMDSSLLGMSVLRRLGGYEVRGDTLTLWR
ncbi:MAG: TIGR02281 family clan AA aspartic protease [Rhodospirillaceae bacterium]|nr:TIGR02281 family clan AA aspartic protease [Rhodospirillaceae bacterium]